MAMVFPTESVWVSCNKFTVQVETKGPEHMIVTAAPIVWRFVGQPLDNLLRWADRRFGGLKWELL
jgi:hypothetical protein